MQVPCRSARLTRKCVACSPKRPVFLCRSPLCLVAATMRAIKNPTTGTTPIAMLRTALMDTPADWVKHADRRAAVACLVRPAAARQVAGHPAASRRAPAQLPGGNALGDALDVLFILRAGSKAQSVGSSGAPSRRWAGQVAFPG